MYNCYFSHTKDILNSVFNSIVENSSDNGSFVGLQTGIMELDKYLYGLSSSNLIIIGGKTSVGKSSLALSICHNVLNTTNKGVLYFSLEMQISEIMYRLLSMKSRYPLSALRVAKVKEDNIEKLRFFKKTVSEYNLSVIDDFDICIEKIKYTSEDFARRNELGLIIVDYIQLVKFRGNQSFSRENELTEISRFLKVLSRELNVPVLALSQLNRNSDYRANKNPKLSDLAGCGAIEQDADIVVFISPVKDKICELNILKNRNGYLASIPAWFEKDLTLFSDIG